MSDKDNNQIFPALTRALGDYLSDEEGNITRNRVISIGAMAIVLGMLCSMDVFAKHRSHSSHSSHVSSTRRGSTHYSHVSHSSHVSSSSGSSSSTRTASASTTSSTKSASVISSSSGSSATAAAATTAKTVTASDAVNRAYQKYISSGFSSNDAMARINQIMPQLQATPANYDSIVSADITSVQNAVAATAQAATAASTAGFTAEQAVNRAYEKYVESGLSSSDAMSRINNILGQLQAAPSNVDSIVASDLAGVSDAAANGLTAVLLTAAEAVEKAYALYIQAGLDSATAMTRIQAILAQIQANPANYLAIVQADLAAMGITLPLS